MSLCLVTTSFCATCMGYQELQVKHKYLLHSHGLEHKATPTIYPFMQLSMAQHRCIPSISLPHPKKADKAAEESSASQPVRTVGPVTRSMTRDTHGTV